MGRREFGGAFHRSAAIKGAEEELERIERDGILRATSGEPRSKPLNKDSVVDGTYIPDKGNIQICLHCEREVCSGGCKLVERYKSKRRLS